MDLADIGRKVAVSLISGLTALGSYFLLGGEFAPQVWIAAPFAYALAWFLGNFIWKPRRRQGEDTGPRALS